MAQIAFTIPGRLPGKQRAGRQRVADGTVHSYNPDQTASAEGMVRWYAHLAAPGVPVMLGPIRLSVYAWRIPPASWSKKKRARTEYVTGKPDVDNTLKLVGDALNGVIWRDDAQIADAHIVRKYTMTAQERVEVLIEELGEAA